MTIEELNEAYNSYFTDAEAHTIENLQKMTTERLFSELDDIVDLLSNRNTKGLPGRAYRRIIAELKERSRSNG